MIIPFLMSPVPVLREARVNRISDLLFPRDHHFCLTLSVILRCNKLCAVSESIVDTTSFLNVPVSNMIDPR